MCPEPIYFAANEYTNCKCTQSINFNGSKMDPKNINK